MFGFSKQRRLNAKLGAAAADGNVRAIEELLDAGADIETQSASQWGDTPLGIAAYKGHRSAVQLLLERGARIEATDNSGTTPLMNAVYGSYEEIVVDLLKRGADRFARNDKGLTAIDSAKKKKENIRALFGIKDAPPPPAPAAEIPAASDEIVVRRKIGDKILDEVFNFSARERISLVRSTVTGPVEAMTRESFDEISESVLRRAFDTYAGQGGTIPETDVFPDSLAKIKHQPRP